MVFQTVFKRYELKYMLTLEQKEKILEAMSPYMELDKYGRTTIRNIYFDTDNYRLIRRSIEKPAYKEKIRIRSYSQATADSTVFVELKRNTRRWYTSADFLCAKQMLCRGYAVRGRVPLIRRYPVKSIILSTFTGN